MSGAARRKFGKQEAADPTKIPAGLVSTFFNQSIPEVVHQLVPLLHSQQQHDAGSSSSLRDVASKILQYLLQAHDEEDDAGFISFQKSLAGVSSSSSDFGIIYTGIYRSNI